MPPTLKVNGQDLSTYLRVQQDDGLDPLDSQFAAPQFGGAPALAEGGVFVAETSRNKEWTAPMWLNSPTGAQGVDDLLRTVDGALQRGPAAVEFRPEGASQSTFFDLEAGQTQPKYSHFHHRRGWMQTDLKLWTKPYGHTATMRTVVASTVSSGMLGPGLYQISGVEGDARALANVYAVPRSFGDGATGFIMYAFTPLPSYTPFVQMPSVGFGSTKVADSHVIASSYRKYAAQYGTDLGGGFGQLATLALPPDGYAGRNRVYVLAGHSFSGAGSGVQLRLVQASHVITQGTALIRNSVGFASGFELVDLGEITVPSQVAGAAPVGTACFCIEYSHAYPTAVATYAVRVNGAIIQPLDHAAGLLVTPGYNGGNNFALRAWPQREVFGNHVQPASGMGPSAVAQHNVLSDFHGDMPMLPRGSQAYFMVWGADMGLDSRVEPVVATVGVQVDVLERFRFLR